MNITDFSTEHLQQELERRKATPKPLENPDFSNLIAYCNQHINDIENGLNIKYSDINEHLYQQTLIAVYGIDVMKWIRQFMRIHR
jgi:hypothetical protein